MGSYFHILKIFVHLYEFIVKKFLLYCEEFEIPTVRIVLRYRNSHTLLVYFELPNDNEQQKKYLSIILALLLAKNILSEYTAMVSCTFLLIAIVMRR
jgi:hypothetical protein